MRNAVLSVIVIGLAAAQPFGWDVVSMAPGINCSDMQFLADGQHGWVVGGVSATGGMRGQVLATADGGATWRDVPYPDTGTVSPEGVFFTSADTGWIVGTGGYISATTDGGLTWARQTSPVSRKLHRVHFVSSRIGWITGGWNDGTSVPLLKTTDGGANWQNFSFGTCYSAEDIWFSDSLNGWVGGYDASLNPFIQHTTDGGATWSPQILPLPTGNGPISAICFPTASIGWATVSSIYQTPAGSILHTTNGGDSWYVQGNTNLHYNYHLDAPDTLHVAIVSTQVLSPQSAKVFVSTNGGAGWTSSSLPTFEYAGGCQYRGNEVWVAQNSGQVLHSSNNGSTWSWQHYAPYWQAVGWRTADEGWVIAGSNSGGGYAKKTTDGGLTWAEDPNCPGGTKMQWLDANYGFTLMEGNSAKVYRTTDGGANWAQFSVGGSNWIGDFCFVTRDSGWACGATGTLRFTSNGGASWSAQSPGVSAYISGVSMVSSREGWIYGGYGGGSGFIRHTTDGGQNWVAQSPSPANHFVCGFFLDNLHGWLGTYNNNIHATTDGGATWQVLGQVVEDYHEDILFTSASTGWLAGGNSASNAGDARGYVHKTTNGGISWTPEFVSPWPAGVVNGLGLKPDGSKWACGGNATLLKNIETGIAGASTLPTRAQLSVTPNPVVTSARITYSLPRPANARLAVYDATGRLAALLVDGTRPAGRHTIAWDGEVGNGVYFVRLAAAGEQVSTRLNRQGR